MLSACAHSSATPKAVDLLGLLANAQKGLGLEERRAAMVKSIRADVRAADPDADTPALEKTLNVVGTLPRERFVAAAGRNAAYVDLPQQIGYGQTISDPYVVSIMTAALDLPPHADVLDVGTGSGYQSAVLSRLAHHVFSVEIVRPLAVSAGKRLRQLGFKNVDVRSGDGFQGWPAHSPFDGIVVAASATAVPQPLLDQLKPEGRLVMPIGTSAMSTQLLRYTKHANGIIDRCSLGSAMFVPLTGRLVAPFDHFGLVDRSIPLCFATPIVWIF